MLDIKRVMDDKQRIIDATPKRAETPVQQTIQAVSRSVAAAQHAEILKEALSKFVVQVYEQTSDGRLWNVTEFGRIEGSIVWGRKGYKEWGMRKTHADVLRYTMLRVSPSPFLYSQTDRRWYLNLRQYPSQAHALAWVKQLRIDGERWLTLYEAWRQRSGNE